MNTGLLIKNLRKQYGVTQAELGRGIGAGKTTVSNYETGYSTPDIETLGNIIKFFGVSADYFYKGVASSSEDSYMRINVYSRVPAGIPIEAINDVVDFEDLSLADRSFSRDKNYIGIVVSGDSMYPEYLDGDIVIVELTPDCVSGSDCVVYINGYDATLKTVYRNTDGSITLRPLNPAYPPITYGLGYHDDEVTILGIVKEIRRKKGIKK